MDYQWEKVTFSFCLKVWRLVFCVHIISILNFAYREVDFNVLEKVSPWLALSYFNFINDFFLFFWVSFLVLLKLNSHTCAFNVVWVLGNLFGPKMLVLGTPFFQSYVWYEEKVSRNSMR